MNNSRKYTLAEFTKLVLDQNNVAKLAAESDLKTIGPSGPGHEFAEDGFAQHVVSAMSKLRAR